MCTLATIFLSALFCAPFASQKDSIKTKPAPASLKKLFEQVVKEVTTQPAKSKDYEIEIDGLLVDDTKTKTGKDFYDLFYSSWEAPKEAKNYTITVSEKPFRLTLTLIVVSINDNMVYQAILQPRQDIVEGLSADAILTTQSYLANYEEIMKELNGEDMSGSGIF
jgi:curli production assembly/transport component CsgE